MTNVTEKFLLNSTNSEKTELILIGEHISDKDIPTIISFLQKNPSIITVNLRNNAIGPEGARDFAANNTTATTVNLSFNHIGDRELATLLLRILQLLQLICVVMGLGQRELAILLLTTLRLLRLI